MKSLKVNFYSEHAKKNKAGLCPIWIRSRHNSKKLVRKSTGLFCAESDWHDDIKRVRDINLKNKLFALDLEICEAYKKLSSKNPATSLADVWDFIRSGVDLSLPASTKVRDWVQYYIDNSPNALSYTRGAKLLLVHLTSKHDLTFDQLTQTRIDSLCKSMAEQGKSSNTILKTLKFIKQVGKMARDEGINVGSLQFRAPKSYHRRAQTEVRLTYAELKQIQGVEVDNDLMKEAKDLFLLQAYTGLRHVDAVRLTKNHIDGPKGFLSIRQQKTGSDVYVTLNQYSRSILNRYCEKTESNDSALFSSFKQQYYNRTIKTIAQRAGLNEDFRQISFNGPNEIVSVLPKWKHIKSHTGRRTYARLLSTAGLEDAIIAEELGHSVSSVTRGYIGSHDHLDRIKLVQAAWHKIEKADRQSKIK